MRFAVSLMAATILASTLGLAQAAPADVPYRGVSVIGAEHPGGRLRQ